MAKQEIFQSRELQNIAVQAIQKITNIPVSTYEDLDLQPEKKVVGEIDNTPVIVKISNWEVNEESPKFIDDPYRGPAIERAALAVATASTSGYMLVEHFTKQESVEFVLAAERVTDIRYVLPDSSQYRVRIYSPLAELPVIHDHTKTITEDLIVDFIDDVKRNPRVTDGAPEDGLLVSIEKFSVAADDGEGTLDKTKTIMTIQAGSDPSINQFSLNQLIVQITEDLFSQKQLMPNSVQTKIRVGAHLRTPKDRGHHQREDELMFAGFDFGKQIYELVNILPTQGQNPNISLLKIWNSILPVRDLPRETEIEAEIEFNLSSRLFQNRSLGNADRIKIIVMEFLKASRI